jgi:hypothetical protein
MGGLDYGIVHDLYDNISGWIHDSDRHCEMDTPLV